jgi:cytochrome c-type biogenesis protein
MNNISYLAAFIAGLFSFFSPCLLPLIPAYFSYLAGTSKEKKEKISFLKNLLFVLGFSLFFTLLGAGAGTIGQYLSVYRTLITQIAGVVILLFGFHLLGLIRFSFLQKTYRLSWRSKSLGMSGAFLLGAVFALGWTPCVGPLVGAVLTYAAAQGSTFKGASLLLTYSLGIGMPFLAFGLLFDYFLTFLQKTKKFLNVVEKISGLFLLLFGFLLLTGNLTRLSLYLTKLIPGFQQ